MGRDIHAFVEIKNRKSNEWDAIIPHVVRRNYKNEKITVPVDFWEGRNGELFDLLNGEDYEIFEPHRDELNDLSPEVASEFVEAFKNKDANGYYGFAWTTFAELYIAYLETPKVKDYAVEWENDEPKYKTNPLKYIIDRIQFWVEDLYGEWDYKKVMTDVRLIYWFDC